MPSWKQKPTGQYYPDGWVRIIFSKESCPDAFDHLAERIRDGRATMGDLYDLNRWIQTTPYAPPNDAEWQFRLRNCHVVGRSQIVLTFRGLEMGAHGIDLAPYFGFLPPKNSKQGHWLLEPKSRLKDTTMHKLLQKRALDAVNTELNKPTEYAAADKTWKRPDAFKGTEYQESSRGGLDRNDRVDQEEKMSSRKRAFPGFKPNYRDICERALDALHALATATSNEDIKACAEMTVQDLQFFMDEEQSKPKKAEIEMHKAPKFLPPRNDIRTHLDEDLRDEIEADKAEDKQARAGR